MGILGGPIVDEIRASRELADVAVLSVGRHLAPASRCLVARQRISGLRATRVSGRDLRRLRSACVTVGANTRSTDGDKNRARA